MTPATAPVLPIGTGWSRLRERRCSSRRPACPSPRAGYLPIGSQRARARRGTLCLAIALSLVTVAAGCFRFRPSHGGGETTFRPPRQVRAADVAVPAGFTIEAVARDLTFPTGVACDEAGRVYVTESGYAYGERWTTPRVLRIERDGRASVVATGGQNGPWNGIAYRDGALYVAEGGALEGGRVLRVDLDGEVTALVEHLPSHGDHHTNGPVAGPDGWIYFGQGTVTNAGVVGEDSAHLGWLTRFPNEHDVPCADVTVAGARFSARDVRPRAAGGTVETGAFAPFGTPTHAGDLVRGELPCNGAVFRIRPRGGPLELVAWGFRNPYGLAFTPEGTLFVTDHGYDDRGSRPVHGAPDLLWAVERGRWYGWPDWSGDLRLDDGDHFVPPGKPRPSPLLTSAPGTPPRPAARLGVHAAATGLDFSRSAAFGWVGQAFVAEWGDQAPQVGKVWGPVGYKVVRVDPASGVISDFAVNRGGAEGPASLIGGGGLERPIAARFDPTGTALYVVDFGIMTMTSATATPQPGTGVLWRITRTGSGR